jgi:ATP-dependent Lon protease
MKLRTINYIHKLLVDTEMDTCANKNRVWKEITSLLNEKGKGKNQLLEEKEDKERLSKLYELNERYIEAWKIASAALKDFEAQDW